ncbi:ribonuclease H-like domain-containing protein [Lyophyllum atratum]|nr:ribonuclease H-like domain-containing protein [Lyophyllum atratum]
MSKPNIDYTFCDSSAALEIALPILKSSTALAFDCEGDKLGRLGGSLSLLSFRTMAPSPQHETFVFDAVKLSSQDLRPIYDILESGKIMKIVFDGRMDYSCLFHDHGVRMRLTVDLQLADIKSRERRGEGETQQLQRLAKVVAWNDMNSNRAQYLPIHRLAGLRQCAEEHKIAIPVGGNQVNHSMWLTRPLSPQSLAYAASDVVIIERLTTSFFAEHVYPDILADSMQYISIWSDKQPVTGDRYRSHPLLPLHVIDRNLTKGLPVEQCGSCLRSLPRTCFPTPKQYTVTLKQCFVCRAVAISNLGSGSAAATFRGRLNV